MDYKISYSGWLLKQLKIQSNSLFTALDSMWNDVKDSKWLDGDSEGFERFPYFLNGLIPLSYALNDQKLINKVTNYMEKVCSLQDERGTFKPIETDDIWPLFLILKVISIYGNLFSDEKAVDVIIKSLKYIDAFLDEKPLKDWGKARYFECFIPMIYVKNKVNNNEINTLITRLATRLFDSGFDYLKLSKNWKKPSKYWCLENHGVNIAMAYKANELYKYLTGIDKGITCKEMLSILDKYHGTVYGHYNADECLSGSNYHQGSELCGIVEAMYSFEVLFEITGDTYYLDRLEKLAYNALPATLLDNMNAHQYDQQVNQIACYPFNKKVIFKTNINEANVFGLQPNYGCCTANFGQGWPLFALSIYTVKDDVIYINIPISGKITYKDAIIECISNYPFDNKITLISNIDIKIKFRKGYNYQFINVNLKANQPRNFYANYDIKSNVSNNGLTYISYGPLVFSLPIKYKMEINEYEKDNVIRKYPYCDYNFYPVKFSNYAFINDSFKLIKRESDNPFDRTNPSLLIKCKMKKVKLAKKKNYEYVYTNKVLKVYKRIYNKYLVPYGSTYLRVTENIKINSN